MGFQIGHFFLKIVHVVPHSLATEAEVDEHNTNTNYPKE